MIPSRFVNTDQARLRFGNRVDGLAPFLERMDPLADDAVLAIESLPAAEGRSLIDRGISQGVKSVSEAPGPLRAFLSAAEETPPWIDRESLERGGEVLFRSGLLGGLVLGAKSLVYGYASPGGNKPLVFSGQLRAHASRRLNETSRFVQATCMPGGLRLFAPGYRITLKVRLMHARVRLMILRSGRWDEGSWGAPINQHDMAATSLLFSWVLLEGLRQCGMEVSAREAQRYLHLWRYSAHLIGVDSRLSIATEEEARDLAELILSTQGPPDDDSRDLVSALMGSGERAARTEQEKANARRRVHFAYGMCRAFLGDSLADQLGIERSPWRFAFPVFRRAVGMTESIRRFVPFGDRQAIAAGVHYWDRVIETGAGDPTQAFRLPESLAGLSRLRIRD